MPNWCNNSITITGPAQKIRALWAQAEKGQGLLQAMVPPPENMFHGNLGEAERAELSEDGTEISGWFDSAWSPPIDAYSEFADLNPDCSIDGYYHESGMCFVGSWNSEGGDDHYEYDEFSSTTVRDNIPEYLVDYWDLENLLAEYEEEEEGENVDLSDLSPNTV
jgi:hypothetical protein